MLRHLDRDSLRMHTDFTNCVDGRHQAGSYVSTARKPAVNLLTPSSRYARLHIY